MSAWWWVVLLGCVLAEGYRPSCRSGGRCQPTSNPIDDEFLYIVEGTKITIVFKEGQYFGLTCQGNITLESEWLPRFNRSVSVKKCVVSACHVPAGAYAAALATLNVTALHSLVVDQLGDEAALQSANFQNLTQLKTLKIEAKVNILTPPPEAGFLMSLMSLAELELRRVPLSPHALLQLPVSLDTLRLDGCDVTALPAPALARLAVLQRLSLVQADALQLPVLPASLANMVVKAPLLQLPAPGRLRDLTVWYAQAPVGELLGGCELRSLALTRWLGHPAPGWLANCTSLVRLNLWGSGGEKGLRLPARALQGTTALKDLQMQFCKLTSLPEDLLADAGALERIDLSYNFLTDLPRGIFSRASSLVFVDLSHNRLSNAGGLGAGWAGALYSLPAGLRELRLASNPLGNLCDATSGNEVSVLKRFLSLVTLELGNTNATSMCPDWSTLPALTRIGLANNNITQINYSSLVIYNRKDSRLELSVDLQRNPLHTLVFSRRDYTTLQEVYEQRTMVLEMDSRLTCDCRVYWLVRAMQLKPGLLHSQPPLRCSSGLPLVEVEADRLSCSVPSYSCPVPCSCRRRYHDQAMLVDCSAPPLAMPVSSPSSQLVLTVRGNLTHLPRQGPNDTWLELHLANNRISHLPPDLLTDSLKVLDLENNSISEVSAAAAARLQAAGRRVSLRGNPLSCACAHVARLAPLGDSLQCGGGGGGGRVRDVARACAVRAYWLAAGLGVAALCGSVALGAWVARHRAGLKALLQRHLGLGAGTEEEARQYDAFVSFAHADLAAAQALVARLERAGLRVCVHYRDWAPGAWIPAQIAASVSAARRTLVLVSRAWEQSAWARAEFRAAHAEALRAPRRRLLVLLLPDAPPRPDLDADMRAFLAANTYLEWNDPWFWDKLLAAMPRPPRPPRAWLRRWVGRGSAGGDAPPVTISAGLSAADEKNNNRQVDVKVDSTGE